MITEKEYLEAQKIVDAYKEQLRIADVMRSKLMAEKQKEREAKCGEHYYLPIGKWQSGMECQDCGKVID